MVMLLVGLLCSSMFEFSGQTVFTSLRSRDYLRAKLIAEAGVNQAYNHIKYDYSKIQNEALFQETPYGEGSFDVSIKPVTVNRSQLVSIGKWGATQARVTADLLNLDTINTDLVADDVTLDPAIFTNYAVLAGGMIEWRGGGEMQGGGMVRANGPVDMVGGGFLRGPGLDVYSSMRIYVQGSSILAGNAHAPLFVGKLDQITGSKVTNQQAFVDVPALDLAPFYQHALANGQVRSGNVVLTDDLSPAGGVLWVNGNLKIANGRFNGCFIATGDLEVSTAQEMTAPDDYPLLISRDGTIRITGTPRLSGLVYARGGSIEWTGGGVLRGSLIAARDIGKGGGSDLVVDFTGDLPQYPGEPGEQTNRVSYVIITAWQQ